MSRRGPAIRRPKIPDAQYNNLVASDFINKLMKSGKKSVAERVLYSALQIIEKQETKNPATVLEQAVENATPLLQVKARRVGGATYQVPVEVEPERGLALALRWLIASARARAGKSMA